MKKVFLAFIALVLTSQAHASLKLQDERQGGLLYGFLTMVESAQNGGDGVLLVSAEISCTMHNNNNQYYCMSDVGGITGEIAELVYKSFPIDTEENVDSVTIRRGSVTCASIEESGKVPRFNCY
ncbi:hypothetical protein [Bdellovibrio sp. HCB-110]|uniref:hypothetical protein n=1 Tax=Bdellovibrio sp. HCB-110 TaxID=3391182 RepID=UPI0039B444BC